MAVDNNWINPGEGAWSNPDNWDVDPSLTPGNVNINNGGTMNFSKSDILGGCGDYNIGTLGGTGTAKHSGGSFYPTGIYIGTYNGNGTLILSGGLIDLCASGVYSINIGSNGSSGTGGVGTFEQSGGDLIANNFQLALNTGKGTANFSGGTATLNDIAVGLGVTATATVHFSGGNVHANALTLGVGEINLSKGTVSVAGDTRLGLMPIGTATFNISGGNMETGGLIFGATAVMNISGSKAIIEVGGSVSGDLVLNSLLDSGGVSTLNAGSVSVNPDPIVITYIPAFVSMKVDFTDVISSGNSLAGLVPTNKTPFADVLVDSDTTLRLNMDARDGGGTTDSWELWNGPYYVPAGDQQLGAVKVEGQYTFIQAVFTGLDDTIAPVLKAYLNDHSVDTGLQFYLWDETSLLMMGDYLNADGYAYFAWDLSSFNRVLGYNVRLTQLNSVPEPATWALLLLGGAAMVALRRRKRK